jgi:hypothetical protein
MMGMRDEPFSLRSSIVAAPVLASARRALRCLPPPDARIRLVRSMADEPAAPARLVLLACLPGLLDGTPEVSGHD